MSGMAVARNVRKVRKVQEWKQGASGADLWSVLELGRNFLEDNGISFGLRYGVCKRLVGMVHRGEVPIPKVIVSLAGKDDRIALAIMHYLRLPGARQHLVLKGLLMHFGEMASAVLVSRACDRLVKRQVENIEWFEYSPPVDKYDFVQPLCAKNAKTATVHNTLRATKGMFEMVGGMTGLQDLTYEGPVVGHAADLRIANVPYEELPDGQTTLVSHLPDTLERLAFEGDCFSLHQFRFGYAWRDRVAAGGFPVLREVRLGGLFTSLIKHDAVETLQALQGLASLKVLELDTERDEDDDGWWKIPYLARAVARFRAARPDVEIIAD